MKTFTLDLNGKTHELRLKSEDAIKIEEMYKVKLLDFIQDYSIKTIVILLRFMLKGGSGSSVSEDEAKKFFDELVDNDWVLETIVFKIILPACEASGLLTESDLELISNKKEEAKATQA